MSLADELLDTAAYLLRQNNKRPTAAPVRRAISTAYYALFHRLIAAATASVVADVGQQQALARSFDHGKMRKACESRRATTPGIAAVLGAPVPDEPKRVAAIFVELQDRRHDADYNLSKSFAREEARDFVTQAREAFAAWDVVRLAPVAKPFLLLLLIGEPKVR